MARRINGIKVTRAMARDAKNFRADANAPRPFRETVLSSFRARIASLCLEVKDRVRQQWIMYDDIEGEADIMWSITEVEGIITAAIWATGQKAWIAEYGKGSLMEKDDRVNPFFAEYAAGDIYNKERSTIGREILGRPYGEYLDLDEEVHHSTGARQGMNVEKTPLSIGGIVPKKPRFVIRNILFGENNSGGVIVKIYEALNSIFCREVELLFRNIPRKIVLCEEK